MGRLKKLGLKCPKMAAPMRILEKWLVQAVRRWSGLAQDWVSLGRSPAEHTKTSMAWIRERRLENGGAVKVGGFGVGGFGLV